MRKSMNIVIVTQECFFVCFNKEEGTTEGKGNNGTSAGNEKCSYFSYVTTK